MQAYFATPKQNVGFLITGYCQRQMQDLYKTNSQTDLQGGARAGFKQDLVQRPPNVWWQLNHRVGLYLYMRAARARLPACRNKAHTPVRSKPMLPIRAWPTQVPTKPMTAHAALQHNTRFHVLGCFSDRCHRQIRLQCLPTVLMLTTARIFTFQQSAQPQTKQAIE